MQGLPTGRKGVGMPLSKLITIIIAVMALLSFLAVGVGIYNKAEDSWWKVIVTERAEPCVNKDYIIKPWAEGFGNSVILHFYEEIPNEELRESDAYEIYEGYSLTETGSIQYTGDDPVAQMEASSGGGPRDNSGSPIILTRASAPVHELRIEVYCEGKLQPAQIEKVRLDWKDLLLVEYLDSPMLIGRSIDGKSAIEWALDMHQDPDTNRWKFWWTGDHQGDESMNLNGGETEEVRDILNQGSDENKIPNIPTTTDFEGFIQELGCGASSLHSDHGRAIKIKRRALQTVTTALFGDLRDFETDNIKRAGETCCANAKRGYTDVDGDANQLRPSLIRISYPESTTTSAYSISSQTRGHGNIHKYPNTPGWIGSEPDAVKIVKSRAGSCFRGKEILVELFTYDN